MLNKLLYYKHVLLTVTLHIGRHSNSYRRVSKMQRLVTLSPSEVEFVVTLVLLLKPRRRLFGADCCCLFFYYPKLNLSYYLARRNSYLRICFLFLFLFLNYLLFTLALSGFLRCGAESASS